MKRPSSFCCSNRENAWTTRQKRMRFSGIEHNLDELLDHTSNAEEKNSGDEFCNLGAGM